MVTFTTRLTTDLRKGVEEQARIKGMSQSMVVRYILSGYFTLDGEAQEELFNRGIKAENERRNTEENK